MPSRFPLDWPESWPRTDSRDRHAGPFRTPPGKTRDHLFHQLDMMGARGAILSTGVPVKNDGEPYANARAPDDPGAAVYFTWRGKPYVVACDQFSGVWSNVRALGKTLESMRAIDRYGASSLLERAMAGYTALPPGEDDAAPATPWWEVLQMPGGMPYEEIASEETHPMRQAALQLAEVCYKQQVPKAHPDRGGSQEAMRELSDAIRTARQVLG